MAKRPTFKNAHRSLSFEISPYELYFFRFQLAIRRVLYGPRLGISLEALSYTSVGLDRRDPLEKPCLFSSDAQFCYRPPQSHLPRTTDRLRAREQVVFIIFQPRPDRYIGICKKFADMHPSMGGHITEEVATLGNRDTLLWLWRH